jgi:hypothetical protein
MHATIEIDCPAAEEIIAPGHYSFRISSSEALVEAEISIDRGPWKPCRHACGLWWFDWNGERGEHQVAARGTTRGGDAVNSHFRRFKVEPRGR